MVKTGIMAAGLLWLILLAPLGLLAQQITTAPNDNPETGRLADLKIRIKELEASQTTQVSPTPIPTPRAPDANDKAEDQNAEDSRTDKPRLSVHGFGELELDQSYEKGNNASSAEGELEILISSRLSNRLAFLGDIEVSPTKNKVLIQLERLLLRYSPSDYFNLTVGRNFTSIGYYNSVHRGTWLQTAADPPLMFESEDEGGLLPIHILGVSANGLISSGSLGLRYIAEIGVGHTSRTMLDKSSKNTIDENNSVAFNFGLLARPDKIPGLQVGVSIYRDRLAPKGMPKIEQTIMAAHLVYRKSTFEMLNEVVVVRHALAGSDTVFNTSSFYTQVSRQFGKYSPYFRYEYLNASAREPLYSDVGLRHGPAFGLRYDLGEFVALTAQYEHTSRRLLSPSNALTLQLTFAF